MDKTLFRGIQRSIICNKIIFLLAIKLLPGQPEYELTSNMRSYPNIATIIVQT